MAEKLDLKKAFPEHYKAGKQVAEVKLPPVHCITFDGQGEPGGASFQNAMGTIYSVAYDIKFNAKARDQDFVVPPCEALYWVYADDGAMLAMKDWRWQILMRMPPGITKAHVEHAKDRVGKKRGDLPTRNVGYEKLREGRAVQVLHVGPYDREGPTVERIEEYLREHDLAPNGPHHEVYLSDPGRTAPDRLKTILRWPVK